MQEPKASVSAEITSSTVVARSRFIHWRKWGASDASFTFQVGEHLPNGPIILADYVSSVDRNKLAE